MFTFGIASGEQGFDPLLLLLIALALEAYVGEASLLVRAGWHPTNAIGALIHALDRKLNREHRSELDRGPGDGGRSRPFLGSQLGCCLAQPEPCLWLD
ncbi:MAG TPA: hypothetical protein QF509_07320 [Rhodospirillales bacterium]|jgi:hypothetical protein|nr:hypothetical protein [Rhodospirillaceae bacterium]HJN23696.1 hypothetical protein [Rhodospirillales bacterium]